MDASNAALAIEPESCAPVRMLKRIRRKRRKRAAIARPCPGCWELFDGSDPRRKYCSDACRYRAKNVRNRGLLVPEDQRIPSWWEAL